EEGRKKFREKLRIGSRKEMGIEEDWSEMKRSIKGVLKEVEEGQENREEKKRGWWDEECREKKREVREELRKGRRSNGGREKFMESKKEYRDPCSRWYEEIRTEGMRAYLRKGWGESRWRRMIRYRLGNEMRVGLYWEEERKRVCRLCGGEEETWEYVRERCRDWVGAESWQMVMGWVLGEEGKGEEWLRRVDEEREEGERGGWEEKGGE
ncbi:hypothetical protein ALC57_13070, partial [Trachymyrmex cornetzi]